MKNGNKLQETLWRNPGIDNRIDERVLIRTVILWMSIQENQGRRKRERNWFCISCVCILFICHVVHKGLVGGGVEVARCYDWSNGHSGKRQWRRRKKKKKQEIWQWWRNNFYHLWWDSAVSWKEVDVSKLKAIFLNIPTHCY